MFVTKSTSNNTINLIIVFNFSNGRPPRSPEKFLIGCPLESSGYFDRIHTKFSHCSGNNTHVPNNVTSANCTFVHMCSTLLSLRGGGGDTKNEKRRRTNQFILFNVHVLQSLGLLFHNVQLPFFVKTAYSRQLFSSLGGHNVQFWNLSLV